LHGCKDTTGTTSWTIVDIGTGGYDCDLVPERVWNALNLTQCQEQAARTLAAFVGSWHGHERILVISRNATATESMADSCCERVIQITYALSNPADSGSEKTLAAVVTSVHTYAGWRYVGRPRPTTGQRYRLTLIDGVIESSFLDANYCNPAADQRGECGA
jgi:hypothetical protein